MKKPNITEDKWESCPDCPDRGWYVSGNPVGSQTQCQFCYQKENSVFNKKLLMEQMIDALIEARNEFNRINQKSMLYYVNKDRIERIEQALEKAGVTEL